MYTSALNFVCGVMLPRLDTTCPRSTPSFSLPPTTHPPVSPGHPLVQKLLDHLPARHHTLDRRPDPHPLDLPRHLHLPLRPPPRHHRPAPRDREHVLDRHQERLVHRALRDRNV